MSSQITIPQETQQHTGAITQVESSRAVQEVQAALVIAKRFPRDERKAIDKIINACTRPSLANQAVYQYARGGSDISGPSIRLAEAMAQSWGNIEFGWKEIDRFRDADGVGVSVVQAFAWDMETNTKIPRTFNVRHFRDKKSGGVKITDERDIYELCANMAARRVRACILSIIPGDVAEMALDQCDVTMRADADNSPEAQDKIVALFKDKFGVTKAQIEKRIQRRMDAIQPAQVIALRKIAQSLRDGMSTPEEWFDKEENDDAPSVTKPTAKKPEPKPKDDDIDMGPVAVDEKAPWQELDELLKEHGIEWDIAKAEAKEMGLPVAKTIETTPVTVIRKMIDAYSRKEGE